MMMYHKPILIRGNTTFTKINILNKIESENIIKNLIERTKKPVEGTYKPYIKWVVVNIRWVYFKFRLYLEMIQLQSQNHAKTKQENIYKNYIEKKKALNVNAFKQFTNFKKQLQKMKEILLNLLALTMTALTQDGGEIPPELQAEIDSLTAAINAMGENPDRATDQSATNELAQRITDLAEKIKDDATKQKWTTKSLMQK